MNSILDQFVAPVQFVPASVEEYIALQLAKRLHDESAIGRYLYYVSRYPLSLLLDVLHEVQQDPDPARAFHLSVDQRKA